MRTFPDRDSAEVFTCQHLAVPVRFVGRCATCGVGAACSVPARWEVQSDLFGTVTADVVPESGPAGSACKHDAVQWQRVVLVDGINEACTETCKDALGGECSCSCRGRAHGSRHRVHGTNRDTTATTPASTPTAPTT